MTGRWRTTSASRRGSAHQDATPNQDAALTVAAVDADGRPAWVVAVSDGHGGRRYVRSDVGARLAVEVATTVVTEALRRTRETDPALLPGAVRAIVETWRGAVLAHAAGHTFTEGEVERAGTTLDEDPLIAYGATLLVAVVEDAGVRLAQLGDGDALVRAHGFARRPVPGDARLVGNETTSLCLPEAAEDFRFADLGDTSGVDLVVVATDGYGNSFGAADWWHSLVGDLGWFVDQHGFDAFADRLPSWLGDSAEIGGDDVTAVVLSRPLPAVPLEPPAALRPAEPLPLPLPGHPGRLRRRRALVVGGVGVLVGVLVGGVATVVAVLGGGVEPDVVPTPTPTSPPPATATTPAPARPREGGERREPELGEPARPGDPDRGEPGDKQRNTVARD